VEQYISGNHDLWISNAQQDAYSASIFILSYLEKKGNFTKTCS